MNRRLSFLLLLTLSILFLPSLATAAEEDKGTFKGNTYLKVEDALDTSNYHVWKLTTDETEIADTDPSDNAWELNASESITFTLRNDTSGSSPPDGPDGDSGDVFEVTAWADDETGEEHLLATLYNETEGTSNMTNFTFFGSTLMKSSPADSSGNNNNLSEDGGPQSRASPADKYGEGYDFDDKDNRLFHEETDEWDVGQSFAYYVPVRVDAYPSSDENKNLDIIVRASNDVGTSTTQAKIQINEDETWEFQNTGQGGLTTSAQDTGFFSVYVHGSSNGDGTRDIRFKAFNESGDVVFDISGTRDEPSDTTGSIIQYGRDKNQDKDLDGAIYEGRVWEGGNTPSQSTLDTIADPTASGNSNFEDTAEGNEAGLWFMDVGEPRAGTFHVRLKIRSEGGVIGTWTANSDDGTTEGGSSVNSITGQGYARSWTNVTNFTTYSDPDYTQNETKFMRGEDVFLEFETSASAWNATGVETGIFTITGTNPVDVEFNLTHANNTYRTDWTMPVDAELNARDTQLRLTGTSDAFEGTYSDQFSQQNENLTIKNQTVVKMSGTHTFDRINISNSSGIQVGSGRNLTLQANDFIWVGSNSNITSNKDGYRGGTGGGSLTDNGDDGSGPGGGGGGLSSTRSAEGGGGGGYGGQGGDGNTGGGNFLGGGGTGGNTYGSKTDQSVLWGSGGGGGGFARSEGGEATADGGSGGAGGENITLQADNDIDIFGKVAANGKHGSKGEEDCILSQSAAGGGGGGGSGGTILMNATTITLHSGAEVNAKGGDGGEGGDTRTLDDFSCGATDAIGGHGGGGGGGRIKFIGVTVNNNINPLVTGGAGGLSSEDGTINTDAGEQFTLIQRNALGRTSDTQTIFDIEEIEDPDGTLVAENTSFWVEDDLQLIHDYGPRLNQSNGSEVFQYLMRNETLNFSITVRDEWNRTFPDREINMSVNTTSTEISVLDNKLNDSSNNSHKLTENRDTSGSILSRRSPEPKYGAGFALDGSNDYLNTFGDIASNDDVAFFMAFEIDEFPSSGSNTLLKIEQQGGGTASHQLNIHSNTSLIYHNSNEGDLPASTETLSTGFHTLTMLNPENDSLLVKVDGTTFIDETGVSEHTISDSELSMGANEGGGSTLDGGLYEARVWEGTLPSQSTLDTIADPDKRGSTNFEETEEGNEVALWFLGTTITDDSSANLSDSITVRTDWPDTYDNSTRANLEHRDYVIHAHFPVNVTTPGKGSYGENRTQAAMFDVDSDLYMDTHVQDNNTLVKDGLDEENEDTRYEIGQEDVHTWVHAKNVRDEDYQHANITVFVYPESGTKSNPEQTFTGNTGADGWTDLLGTFTAEQPSGDWFFEADAGRDASNNSGTKKQTVVFIRKPAENVTYVLRFDTGPDNEAQVTNRWSCVEDNGNQSHVAWVFTDANPLDTGHFNTTPTDHHINITQDTDEDTYLPFTQNSCQEVDDTEEDIEDGEFQDRNFPAFAYEDKLIYTVNLILDYDNIVFNNNLTWGEGSFRLTLRNNETTDERVNISSSII